MENTRGNKKSKRSIERDAQLAILQEEIRILRLKDEKIQNKIKSRSNSGRVSRSNETIIEEDGG